MATRQCLPKARRVWKRGRCPRLKEGAPRRCPFLNHRRRWHTVGSSTRETLPPFRSLWAFSYRSLRIRPGKHSVWCQGVSGVVIPRFAPALPLCGHRYIPSRVPRPAGSPFFRGTRHNPRGFSHPSQRPLRGGGIMANFRSRENGRDYRLVPPHSLAFRPEWYPRVLHPTPRRHASQQERRCAAWVPAERSAPARGPAHPKGAKPRREASRIEPTLSVRSHAAPTGSPRGVSVQEPPPASAHRVDGHVSAISLHALGTNEFRPLKLSPIPPVS